VPVIVCVAESTGAAAVAALARIIDASVAASTETAPKPLRLRGMAFMRIPPSLVFRRAFFPLEMAKKAADVQT
jgi:hypothetical protein